MVKWFLNFLEKHDRKKIILDRDSNEPYLVRYYLFLKDRKYFPFNVFLHKFLRSDPDDLHDHPWPFMTIILKGGYWEHTPKGRFWRGPGTVRFAGSRSLHRVELDPTVTETWTMFFPGPQIREWGFIKNGKWIDHNTYHKMRKEAVK